MIIKKVGVSGYKNLNINWDLSKSGNIVALIGKNASGKTNLLEALMGFSNVADNSKSIKPNFKGEMELEVDGQTVWINGKGVFQKTSVESVHRKSSKKTIEGFDIPDMVRISINDDFAPRYFTAQRKFRRFDEKDVRFSIFNEIKYGEDFIPFLLFLFSFSKESDVRKILLDEFGIEGIAPVRFGTIFKKEEIDKLQQPTKSYFEIIRDFFLNQNNKVDSNEVEFNEEQLMELAQLYGYESDFFEAMHILLGNYVNNRNILYTDQISVIKRGIEIKISDLSDGEKQLIYLLAIMTYFVGKNTIILLDEPDTHIYPTLQMNLVDYLRRINDKANIIIATHSPYIVSSLGKHDVFCLYDGQIFSVGHTQGKDYNSLLREVFNTPVRPIKYQEILDELYSLVEKTEITKDDLVEINNILKVLENDLGEDDPVILEIKTLLQLRKNLA